MIILSRILLLAAFFGTIMTACLKEPNLDPTYPSQLFRPITFTGNVDAVNVAFTWAPIKDASYLLEISRDSLLFERDLQSIPIDGQIRYEIEDLKSLSRYSARIKAVSKNPAVKDSEYQTISFTTGLENIFFQIDSSDISQSSIDLSWMPGKSVTHIEISTSDNSAPQRIVPDNDQILAGSLLVENLEPGQLYTFRIYNGDILRGSIAAQTKPEK